MMNDYEHKRDYLRDITGAYLLKDILPANGISTTMASAMPLPGLSRH